MRWASWIAQSNRSSSWEPPVPETSETIITSLQRAGFNPFSYLDALPNARLAPTTDPAWDRVKLDVQQTIGLAVQPGGDPRQVLDQLQKNATAAESGR